MAVPSRRTWVPESKPEPKICTPRKSQVLVEVGVQVSVACGTKALGTPPTAPEAPVGLGTITSETCVDFIEVAPVKLIISICPGVAGTGGVTLGLAACPDSTTKAWSVAGSTAIPPQRVRAPFGIPLVTGTDRALGPRPLTSAYLF